MGIELKTKQGNITLTAPKASGGGSVDLSNYYTKAQTDKAIETAINAIDIPDVDLSDYALKADIPDVSLFVTGEYVQTSINQSLPNMSEYAKKSDVPSLEGYAKAEDIPDVSAYQTEEQVIALIEEYGGSTLPASEEGEF